MVNKISSEIGGSGSSFTIPADCTKLVVFVANHQWGAIGQMHVGGQNMTIIDSSINGYSEDIDIWYIDNPLTGSQVIVDSVNGNDQMVVAVYLKGAKTGTPSSHYASNSDSSGCSIPITTPSDASYFLGGVAGEPPVTAEDATDERLGTIQLQAYENLIVSGRLEASAGSKTMGFTVSYGARIEFAGVAIESSPDSYIASSWYSNFTSYSSNGGVNNPNYLTADDANYGTWNNTGILTSYGYNQAVRGDSISGIEVIGKAWADLANAGNYFVISLSWDGGTSWVTKNLPTAGLGASMQTFALGSSSDNWGHAFTLAEINSSNFRIRVTYTNASGTSAYLQYLAWRAWTTLSGGPWNTQIPITADADDGEEDDDLTNSTQIYYPTTYTYDNFGGDITTGPTTNWELLTGLTFKNIIIPRNASILEARIGMAADGAYSNALQVRIGGLALDNGYDFTDVAGHRPSDQWTAGVTSNIVPWTFSDAWVDLTYYQTPDIKTIIQEIVNRGGWNSGQNLSLIIRNNNSPVAGAVRSIKDSYSGYRPVLLVKWTPTVYLPFTVDGIIFATNTQTFLTDGAIIQTTSGYSRQNSASLPTDVSNLSTLFSDAEYTNVGTVEGTTVDQYGKGSFPSFNFRKKNTNNTDQITLSWTGKSTIATSVKTAYLQIYNYNSASWETVASNNSTGVNTNFTLSGTKSTSLSNYYDSSFWITARVYQDLS